jgi:hypothetical protein
MGVFHALRGYTASNEYLADERCEPEPTIEPGQIWLVECESASLSGFHAGLLTRANVVLYDRALSALVAEALPTGAYAEPLPAIGSAGPVITPRTLQFAADGWSVLQMVERRPGWRRLLRSISEELNRPGGGKSPLLAIGTITASRYRPRQYRQWRDIPVDLAIVAAELGSDELLSLIFAPSGASPSPRPPTQGQVFTANGLAG